MASNSAAGGRSNEDSDVDQEGTRRSKLISLDDKLNAVLATCNFVGQLVLLTW